MNIDTSDSKQIVPLVGQVQKLADNVRDELTEADRVAALAAAHRLIQSLEKPKEAIIKMAFSSASATSVRIGMDMNVIEALSESNKSLTLEELADLNGADAILMERILSLLASIGYIKEPDVRTFAANSLT